MPIPTLRYRFIVAALAFFATLTGMTLAHAEPFVPASDDEVLERVAERNTPAYRQLKALQVVAAKAPGDPSRATALAAAYLRVAREEGDPRYLGYAQAALSRWWKDADAPSDVLVLRATIRQSLHDFDTALVDLDRVVAREPRHAQALLTRATVLTVQGKYAKAREDCARLAGAAPEIYVVACGAAIDSVTGKARPAQDALTLAIARVSRRDTAARAWVETLQAEIAARLDDPAAEAHFRAGLDADARDLYLIGAYSDWLLDRQRAGDVVPLVVKETRVDPLVLRLALAQQALNRPDATATISALRAQFAASRARGDTVHRREEARFELHLGHEPAKALALARANWDVQREPADLRILAETAAATHDAASIALVRDWLAQSALEFPAVAALVGAAPRNADK